MTKEQAADSLEKALQAFTKQTVKGNERQELAEFQIVNNCIRAALPLLDENPMDATVLEERGILNTPMNEPIPDTYVPGVKQLIEDLRA